MQTYPRNATRNVDQLVMVENIAKVVKKTLVNVMVVTIEDKVKEMTNSNVEHNTKGSIYGEIALRTGRVKLIRKYTDVVVNVVKALAEIMEEVANSCIIYSIYLLLL